MENTLLLLEEFWAIHKNSSFVEYCVCPEKSILVFRANAGFQTACLNNFSHFKDEYESYEVASSRLQNTIVYLQ